MRNLFLSHANIGKNIVTTLTYKDHKMNKTLNTLLAGAVALTIAGAASNASAADGHGTKDGQEKCYGVVKAGMNDCASADGKHGCAGMASMDASPNEWVSLPSGVCDKLAGGSTKPKKH